VSGCGSEWPCEACATPIVYSGRGAPRKFCSQCMPPGARAAEWRALDCERVRLSNAARRRGPFPVVCQDCGEVFEAVRRDSTRDPACQAERRRARDRARKARDRSLGRRG